MKKLLLGLLLAVGMFGSLGVQGADAHSGCYYPRPYYRHHPHGYYGWYRPAYYHRHYWGCGCPGWGYRDAYFYDYGPRHCGW